MRLPRLCLLSTASLVLLLATEGYARTAKPKSEPEESCVVLKPFVVKGEPITCFGLSLFLVADPETRRISRIYVLKVDPDSEAALKGFKKGTEILEADEHDVRLLEAVFEPGSALNRLFMNRKTGARITLVIVPSKGAKPRTVELTQGYKVGVRPMWLPEDSP